MADRLADFVVDFIGRHRDRPFFVYYPMDIVHRPLVATPDRPGAAGGGVEGLEVRAFDATTVREPGRTGSLWRVHYSLCLSSLRCDFFAVTPARGAGNGEHFTRFPVRAGEYILADRGYATASGLRHVSAAGGWVTVRVTRARRPCIARTGRRSICLRRCPDCGTPGRSAGGPPAVPGRVCTVRKSVEAARRARKRARREVRRQGSKVKPETLAYANYVIVFTTFPEEECGAREVLECYRLRWQVELAFKRLKSLARRGHLPKRDPESARAWLYGKLLLALLADKAIHHARTISPWGYDLAPPPNPWPLARGPLRPQPTPKRHRTALPPRLHPQLLERHLTRPRRPPKTTNASTQPLGRAITG